MEPNETKKEVAKRERMRIMEREKIVWKQRLTKEGRKKKREKNYEVTLVLKIIFGCEDFEAYKTK